MIPRVTDNDRDEIIVTLDGKELRGWSYSSDDERRVKMLCAREFLEGYCVRADLAERMAEALDGLVRINEDHNEAISQIIGRALNWKDGYLDQARSALSAFKSATQDTEANR